ncbi:hypothetical protein TW95_gp0347 [Pandoravirus inopinatum]|uniref:Uncharacterized protein n=1 Tax=Pandoravirus inopinatum TaxID=1605721 RepID=A0A0B5J8G0_9VIRU|nr:hypothetical protein TW95_gp0347 [Pandoravirus inopinatum]AJF97081.1 hypothetical protein [Pandoravirus inopinatum]
MKKEENHTQKKRNSDCMDEAHGRRIERQGEITRALACDDAARLASILAASDLGFVDTIDLPVVIAALAPSGGVAGIVSPARMSSVVARDDLSRACRSATSARLPQGDIAPLALALFYGAHRCFDHLVANGAQMSAEDAESLLVHFCATHAWREAAVCWGPCRLLQSRRDRRLVSPMIVAAIGGGDRGSGSRVRFLDPLPVAQRLMPFLAAVTPAEEPKMRERLMAAVHGSVVTLVQEGGAAPDVAAIDRVLTLVDGATPPLSRLLSRSGDIAALSDNDAATADSDSTMERAHDPNQ